MHSCLLCEAKDVEYLICQIHSAGLSVSCHAPETALELAKMAPARLDKLLQEQRVLQERRSVPMPEVDGATEIEVEDEMTVEYRYPWLVKRITSE